MPTTIDSSGITFPDASVQATAGALDSGTVMLFKQTSAPTGWTKDVANNNNGTFRVVTGTISTGGTVDFTTAFASQSVSGTIGSLGSYTLQIADIPSHTHTLQAASFNAGYLGGSNAIARSTQTTSSTGGGGSHTHTGGTFTGTAINLAVKYTDFIVATKD